MKMHKHFIFRRKLDTKNIFTFRGYLQTLKEEGQNFFVVAYWLICVVCLGEFP